MTVRHVALIAGPPCGGKSTLAAELARVRPGIVLDRDVIARGLGSVRGWMHEADLTERAEQIMRGEVARIGQADDVVAYVVRSVPAPGARAALARQLRADVVYVVDPGMRECMRRATADSRPPGTHAGVREWYRRYGASGVDRRPDAVPLPTSRRW